MSKFFIDRPIFAIVIALLAMLAGGLSILGMPIEQYPTIAPPSIQITATYPGASAQTVENTVVQVIEQQMNGLNNLLYLASTSDDSGTATTTLTFAAGTNPDIAQVQVQNKLQLATPLLPAQVQQAGIRVTQSSSSYLLIAGFVSSDNSMSRYDIANYVVSHLQDPLSRVNGVGNFNVFGTQYAMRIWLDTDKLNSFALTPVDVANAITNQNVQVAGGQLGGTPAPPTQRLTATITEATLLRTPTEFGNILLKVNPDGSQVRIRDVARVELGAETYFIDSRYNGQPASGIGIQLAPGANALDTANAGESADRRARAVFPAGSASRVSVRHDAVREDLDHRSREDAVRGHRAGVPGDVPLPAELPGDADPDHRGAGRAARNVRHPDGLRVHDQHAVDVRHGARHRPAGRRRDRRRRKRRARDGRGRAVAASRRPARRWGRSPARWSASPSCSAPCSCRWPSRADRSARSTGSSR